MKRMIAAALLVLVSVPALAQEPDRAPIAPGVIKDVLLDPTTYVPALVGWKATRLDWDSSQVFFQNGSFEQNPHFTLSGIGGTPALAYGVGNRQILMDAIANLQMSALNNVSMRLVERLLIPRHPTHGKLIRAIGWVERSALASYLTYEMSAGHFRQWQQNDRQAGEFGYR
jgi:hypothetical protein